MSDTLYIAIIGDPAEGAFCCGPFEAWKPAEDYAARHFGDRKTMIVGLFPPREESGPLPANVIPWR